jgi:DNA-binding transcriptional MerR regulator
VSLLELYSAKQVAEILEKEHPQMNVRTVRYYTQIGLIPSLELVGNRRGYTEKHIDYFRAILTLSKSGDTLASIKEKFNTLSQEEVAKIGENMHLLQSNTILHNKTVVINEDVIISMSPRISAELRTKMIATVSQMFQGE